MSRPDRDGLYRRGRSPYWWMSYMDASGKRQRQSTGKKLKSEARAILDTVPLDKEYQAALFFHAAHRLRQYANLCLLASLRVEAKLFNRNSVPSVR